MKRFTSLIIFCLVITNTIHCQELDDWGEIEPIEVIENTQKKITAANYWDEHFYGSLSGSFSFGANHYRYSSEAKLGFNEHWINTKILIEANTIAKKPINDAKKPSMGPTARIAPTIITLEIAFVTPIRGECKAGVTDHTTKYPIKHDNINTVIPNTRGSTEP